MEGSGLSRMNFTTMQVVTACMLLLVMWSSGRTSWPVAEAASCPSTGQLASACSKFVLHPRQLQKYHLPKGHLQRPLRLQAHRFLLTSVESWSARSNIC
ncbi:hypothetical protein GOP47_0024375 [Adiantum capillus-veneris]|uniref:Uncharacterized protein n=1 Tax=Adiantum capillus-veneris TaxID=13818 RepID=A0A9D4U2X0_ADICA|nr:hypothetical protein GOP47_0024375 [Adiantum capillus-veneris]